MPGLREAALSLASVSSPAGLPPFRFVPLRAPTGPPEPCVAVDGSHAVLVDNGAFWIVATRAAAVTWPGPPPLEQEATVAAVTPSTAQERLDGAYAAWGLEAPAARSAETFAQGLRALQETDAAIRALQSMPAGGLLLVDGALGDLPPGPQALADRICAAATRASVTALGVSKRSALARDGIPLVSSLQAQGPPGAWAVAVEDGTFVARLHAAAQHAFRIDAPDLAAVARLLPYCRDAVYTGYPYPLALAHNAVALTNAHARDLRTRLREEVRRAGGAVAGELLKDFHETLDRNVPG